MMALAQKFKYWEKVIQSPTVATAVVSLNSCSFFFYSQNDYDMVDYLNELRESCLEAYTGVVQGLKGEDEKNISREYLLLSTSLNLLNLLLYYL